VLKQTSQKLCTRIITESMSELDDTMPSIESFSQFEAKLNNILRVYSETAKGSEKSTVLLHALLKHYFPKANIMHNTILNRNDDKYKLEREQQQHLFEKQTTKLKKDYQEEIKTLNDQSSKLSAARDKYKEQCMDLTKTLQKLKTTIVSQEKELNACKQRNSELSEDHRRQSTHIDTLQTHYSQMTQSYEDMKKSFFELKEAKTRVDEQLHSETMESESLKVELSNLRRSSEILETKYNDDQQLLLEANNNTQHLEHKYKDSLSQVMNLEETLSQTSELLSSAQNEKQELGLQVHRSEEQLNNIKVELLDTQSQLRKMQREVTNKTAIIRSYERAMSLEKEKAVESENRLRLSLKEKAHLLSSDRALELEKQVEQLNITNRRILELNKVVMEESKMLKEQLVKLGGSVSTPSSSSSSSSFARTPSPGTFSASRLFHTPDYISGNHSPIDVSPLYNNTIKEGSMSSPTSPTRTSQQKKRERSSSSSLVVTSSTNGKSSSNSKRISNDNSLTESISPIKQNTSEGSNNTTIPSKSSLSMSSIQPSSGSSGILARSNSAQRRSPSPSQRSTSNGKQTPSYYDFEKIVSVARPKTFSPTEQLQTTSILTTRPRPTKPMKEEQLHQQPDDIDDSNKENMDDSPK
jgi:hypothetical protein